MTCNGGVLRAATEDCGSPVSPEDHHITFPSPSPPVIFYQKGPVNNLHMVLLFLMVLLLLMASFYISGDLHVAVIHD